LESNKATKVLIILSDDLESQSIDIRKVAFQQIRSVIKTTDTRHTAQTAFRAIEERLARPWLGTVAPAASDGKSERLTIMLKTPSSKHQ
jgi:Glu-tRNA(Gln) amidotransferase subunit E-like FAD-binding protein